ncbi:hypothetical protein X797_010396 [Metarhizium robertsii]|uniref:Uncharacterized protein n=1 Tax=Metarhizium robertsii TaxID=568076 RepID=A0A0A1UNZ1_9HYPO|nr:hypothetical protein X797_010396 [Metarhizium robertsii]
MPWLVHSAAATPNEAPAAARASGRREQTSQTDLIRRGKLRPFFKAARVVSGSASCGHSKSVPCRQLGPTAWNDEQSQKYTMPKCVGGRKCQQTKRPSLAPLAHRGIDPIFAFLLGADPVFCHGQGQSCSLIKRVHGLGRVQS